MAITRHRVVDGRPAAATDASRAPAAAAQQPPAAMTQPAGGGAPRPYAYVVFTSSHKTGTVQLMCLSRVIRSLARVALDTTVSASGLSRRAGRQAGCGRRRGAQTQACSYRGQLHGLETNKMHAAPRLLCYRWATPAHPISRQRRRPPRHRLGGQASCCRCCRSSRSASAPRQAASTRGARSPK